MRIREYRNVLQGARSKHTGEFFEKLIDASCAYYQRVGVANIEKTPEPMKPLKPLGAGKFVAVFSKAAQPDYKGTLKGGQSVVFEAKHTDTEKLLFSRLTDEQLKQLQQHAKLGAIAFVLCSFGFERFAAIPFERWKRMKEFYGRKYITADDLGEYEIFHERGRLDFLSIDN